MDPVSMVAAAVAMGAAAGLQGTVSHAIEDAYTAMKTLIRHRYGNVDLAPVEAKPESAAKRASFAEDLASAGAATDDELQKLASAVINAVTANKPETVKSIGVDLEEVRAASLRVRDVKAGDVGVRVHKGEFTGDIDIQGVEATSRPNPKV